MSYIDPINHLSSLQETPETPEVPKRSRFSLKSLKSKLDRLNLKQRYILMLVVVLVILIGFVGQGVLNRGQHSLKNPTTSQATSQGSSSSTSPSSSSPSSSSPSQSQPPAISFSGKQLYGVATGAEIFNDSQSDFTAEMQGIHDMGVTWLRSTISWKATEKSKGVYDWSGADRLVNTASSLGLQMIAGVNQNPSWSTASSNYGCAGQPNPNFSIEDYASYAKALVNRYHSKVKVWELGNEPNHVKGVWTHPNACQYTVLLKQTYAAIKSVDPTATVLVGGIGGTKDENGDIAGNTFARALYAAGAKPYFDGISYHPYSYPASPKDADARVW